MEKKLLVIFPPKADLLFTEIAKKYNLPETTEEIIKNVREKKLSREVLLDYLIKDLVTKKISFKEFILNLEKSLEIQKETAENLAKDVKESLLPFLDVISEDERERYNAEKAQQKRYVGPKADTQTLPYVKKPDIANVEKNAEETQKEKKFTDETKKSMQEQKKEKIKVSSNRFSDEKKGSDTYREPIDSSP